MAGGCQKTFRSEIIRSPITKNDVKNIKAWPKALIVLKVRGALRWERGVVEWMVLNTMD